MGKRVFQAIALIVLEFELPLEQLQRALPGIQGLLVQEIVEVLLMVIEENLQGIAGGFGKLQGQGFDETYGQAVFPARCSEGKQNVQSRGRGSAFLLPPLQEGWIQPFLLPYEA